MKRRKWAVSDVEWIDCTDRYESMCVCIDENVNPALKTRVLGLRLAQGQSTGPVCARPPHCKTEAQTRSPVSKKLRIHEASGS